jgi:hypothetical protein
MTVFTTASKKRLDLLDLAKLAHWSKDKMFKIDLIHFRSRIRNEAEP